MRDIAPERWREIEEVVDAVLDLPAEQRSAFLDERCGTDLGLRTEVERILTAGELPTPIPASPASLAGQLLAGMGEAEGNEFRPTRERIGPYQIVREIGHGGMGTVYLAERDDDQFHKRVAIKLLRQGLGTEELVRRFRHERQILARLEHANVARLLDGGVVDGSPYFVMEYVEGEPLDAYCERNRLSLPQRLRLFGEVCAAVQYAHQNLIVHRDLKPSNILVTREGQVKLLDFGIAKLLDDGAVEAPLTRTGMHVMTPEYAAPEQVRGAPVTTATDVYALGIILYQLLVGQRPYEVAGRSLSEIERVICETDPPRPSTAVRRMTRDASTREGRVRPGPGSRGWRSGPERFGRKLRGDLDTIVMMALQKDPRRRYPSAAALLEDLRRYQEGHPVLARPETAVYRARKFIVRNKAGVAVALLILLIGQGFGLREAQLRRRAEANAERAAAVRDYLADVFQVSDPDGTTAERGEEVSARTLLDRGLARIDEELQGQPEAQAEMLGVLGGVYMNLGLLEDAERLLQRSYEQRRGLYGTRHAAVAEAADALAALRLAQGRHDEAEVLARDALVQRRSLLGANHEATAQTLDRLATVLQEKSAYVEAESLFREALAIRERLLGDDHPDFAQSLNNLAVLLNMRGMYDEAEQLYRRSLPIFRRSLGDEHGRTALTLGNLAQVLHSRGDLAESERHYRESLEIRRKVFGELHPRVTVNLSNLGVLLRDMDRYEEAEQLIAEALASDRAMYGDEHPYVAANLLQLGGVLVNRGRFDEAEAAYAEARDLTGRLLGEEHVRMLQVRFGMALLRQRKGDLRGAEEMYRLGRELALELFDADHLWVINCDLGLGLVLQAQSRNSEAEPFLRRIVDGYPPDHPALGGYVIGAMVGLGKVHVASGRAAEGEPLLRRALEASRAARGNGHWRTAEPLLGLGEALAAQRRFEEAEPLLLEAYELMRVGIARPWLVEQSRAALARHYTDWGRPDRARAYTTPDT